MEKTLLKEIHYLTNLIQQHEKFSEEKPIEKDNLGNCNKGQSKFTESLVRFPEDSRLVCQGSNECNRKVKSTNVYINPNFKRQNPVIHVNPNVPMRPPIHVNPKIVKDENISMNKIQRCNTVTTIVSDKKNMQLPTKQSVYVHPQLMKKLVCATESKKTEFLDEKPAYENIIKSQCNQITYTNNISNTFIKKQSNCGTLFLSRRKLVRKTCSTFTHTEMRRSKCLAASPFKKISINSLKSVKNISIMNPAVQSTKKDYTALRSDSTKLKTSRYKIIRTTPSVQEMKKQNTSKVNNGADLITIGGVVYKSSRNQLIRRSLPFKRKSIGSIKKNKFVASPNSKNLYKPIVAKNVPNQSVNNISIENTVVKRKRSINMLQKYNHKNTVSNKVKQKSIQILRNKMRKNNQPCLLYQKFGYCANHEKGLCPKLHDKKQVSLCKRFLQGKCLLDNCPLSHDVGPEKMPTCKYFLEGCCLRETCPYRHIKVSSNTSICIEFLKGYCAKGNECKQRHERLCPEFEKSGKCPKGKYCPYPHKSHPSTVTQIKNNFRKQTNTLRSESQTRDTSVDTIMSAIQENKLRYYQTSDTLSEDISKKRRKVLKRLEIAKPIQTNVHSNENDINDQSEVIEISETESTENDIEILDDEIPRRRPLGSLPAYIPIN